MCKTQGGNSKDKASRCLFYAEKVKLKATRQTSKSEKQKNPHQAHAHHNPDIS